MRLNLVDIIAFRMGLPLTHERSLRPLLQVCIMDAIELAAAHHGHIRNVIEI